MAVGLYCQNCLKKYTTTLSNHPILLECGHTFCSACLTRGTANNETRKTVLCFKCKAKFHCNIENNVVVGLLPNIAMLGYFELSKNKKLEILSRVKRLVSQSQNKVSTCDKFAKQKCSECIEALATVSCVQCGINLCSSCFDIIHSNSRVLRRHQSINFRSSGQNMAMLDCKDHHSLTEFFCVDDGVLICRECICSQHSQHKIISLRDKAIDMREEVKSEVEECTAVISLLKNLIQGVEEEIKDVEMEAVMTLQDLLQTFLDVVGMAQANLFSMLNVVGKISVSTIQELISIKDLAVSRLETLEFTCSDASLILNSVKENEICSVNPLTILEKLKKLKTTPCVLEKSIQVEEDENQNVEKDDKIFEKRVQITMNNEIFSINKEWCLIKEKRHHKYLVKVADKNMLKQAEIESTTTEIESDVVEEYAPKLRQIKVPTVSYQELVYVTFIINPVGFYVQRERDRDQIIQIENQLKVYNSRAPKESELFTCIRIGELCVARYVQNRKWYRSRVSKVYKNKECDLGSDIPDPGTAGTSDEIEICFIDYGNLARTRVCCLRVLPAKLLRIPPLAIPCSLVGISPIGDKWTLEADKLFTSMVANRTILMTTITRDAGRRFVDLHKPSPDEIDEGVPISVRDAMLFLNKAGFSKEQFPTSDIKLPSLKSPKRKFLAPTVLSSGTFVPCVLSNYKSLDSFCIQLNDSNADYLNQMSIKIQKFCKGKLYKTLNPACPYAMLNPVLHMPCLAYCTEFEMWFRAIIIAVFRKEHAVRVLFVDYGNEKVLHIREALLIPDSFMKLPYQALECRLGDIKKLKGNEDWDPECVERFLELASDDKDLMVYIRSYEDKIYKVELFDETDLEADDQCLSINERLVSEGFATGLVVKKAKDQISIKNKELTDSENECDVENALLLTPEFNNPSNQEGAELTNQGQDKDDGKISVRVLKAKSPASIYLKTNEQWKTCNDLVKKIHKYYSGGNIEKDEHSGWKRGDVCAIYSSAEKRWCRGLLESDCDKESFVVNCVDFVCYETIGLTSLRPLKPEFCVDEPLISHCCLSSILPAGGSNKWTSNACESLKEMISGNQCAMLLDEESSHSEKWMPVPVQLFVRDEQNKELDVNKELVMNGFALPYFATLKRRQLSDKPLSNVEKSFQVVSDKYHEAEAERLKSNFLPWPTTSKENMLDGFNLSSFSNDFENVLCDDDTEGIVFDQQSADLSALKLNNENSSTTEELLLNTCQSFDKKNFDLPAESYQFEGDSSNNMFKDHYKFDVESLSQEVCPKENDPLNYRPAELPLLNKMFKCKVTHIERFDVIFISITAAPKSYSDEPISTLPALSKFEPETPCFSCYSEDGQWNRAKVLGHNPGKKQVLVEYVDYGLSEILDEEKVRSIPLEMLSHPVQAIMCILTDVNLPENVPEMSVLEKMADLVGCHNVMCKIVSLPPNGLPVVKLYLIMEEDGEKDNVVPFSSQLKILLQPLINEAYETLNALTLQE